MKINQGGVLIANENIESATQDMLITGSINVSENTDTAKIMFQINNYFNLTGKTYQPVMAFYDIDGRLLSCVPAQVEEVGRDENIKSYDIDIPHDAVLLKVFAWESLDTIKPILPTNETDLSS